MATIADCLTPEIRQQMYGACTNPFHGEPRSFAEWRRWRKAVVREILALRLELDWGKQHGHAATEGFYFWFQARRLRLADAEARYKALNDWREDALLNM